MRNFLYLYIFLEYLQSQWHVSQLTKDINLNGVISFFKSFIVCYTVIHSFPNLDNLYDQKKKKTIFNGWCSTSK